MSHYDSRKSAALFFGYDVPSKSDSPLDEALRRDEIARAEKATAANKNRPETRALPAAIVAVCARHKRPLKLTASEKFGESLRAEIRHEVYAAADSKTKKRLSRKPKWPLAPVVKRVIRVIPKECGKN